jgi:hypothetical protein
VARPYKLGSIELEDDLCAIARAEDALGVFEGDDAGRLADLLRAGERPDDGGGKIMKKRTELICMTAW